MRSFDEGYGSKPEFLRELQAREQPYVAEVPRTFSGWLEAPQVTDRPFRRGGRGRGRAVPRLVAGSTAAQSVEYHLNWTPALKEQAWRRWRIKDTQRGPQVWEVKHALLVPKDDRGLPAQPLHLIVARNLLDRSEVKYFIAAAALVRSWSLGRTAAKTQIAAAVTPIKYYQQRNAGGRRSHTKTTVRKLHALDINLTELPRFV